ncbi:MAG: hypothetical protein E3J52_00735 [Promethearchaeota archaeon]|nr:MAG: hypothetical protein E3J52_00735 [Candidatus Lokiarchaeota archaeon]
MNLKSTPKIYNYLDGNGNKYIISNELIEYIPVKPSFSSSGVYNGGDYIKKEISEIQYNKLATSLNIAIKNKKCHIKNRVKMSGLIVIQEENKEKAYILSPGSEEISKIENLLKNMISN